MTVNRRSEAGLATLEMALVLPLLLLLVFAIVDFGLAFARLQVVQNAAREGARAATLFRANCSTSAVNAGVNEAVGQFSNTLGMPALTIAPLVLTDAENGPCDARLITVTVTFRHEIPATGALSKLFGSGVPSFITLTGSSTSATPVSFNN